MEINQTANPLISIILPVKNREDFLGACIESIRAQTYPHWELLVFDDESTDRSAAIARSFQEMDARIRLVHFPSNGATGKIKNFGLSQAQGSLICFMDSDDLWPSEKLEKQWKALQDYPEAAFAFTNGYNFEDADGKITEWFYDDRTGSKCDNFFKDICSGNIGVRFPSLMIRKEILKNISFKEDRLFTDLSFILELSKLYNGVLMYEPLFQRRCHSGNLSSSGWNSDYEEHTSAIREYIRSEALTKKEGIKILRQLHLHWGLHWLSQKDFQQARKHFSIAWSLDRKNLVPLRKMLRSFIEQLFPGNS